MIASNFKYVGVFSCSFKEQVITSHFIALVCVLLLIIARCTYYCIRDRKYLCQRRKVPCWKFTAFVFHCNLNIGYLYCRFGYKKYIIIYNCPRLFPDQLQKYNKLLNRFEEVYSTLQNLIETTLKRWSLSKLHRKSWFV